MADDVTILDASGARVVVSAEEITTLNGSGVAPREVQRVMLATVSGVAATDISTASPLPVSDAGGSLTVDDGGTTLSIDDGAGSLTVDGSVGVTSVPADPFGANADAAVTAGSAGSIQGKLRALTNPMLTTPNGNVAHGAADSGSPLKFGARVRTALIAALSQDNRSDLMADKFGRLLTTLVPVDQVRSGTANYTTTSAADVIAAPGASIAVVVTAVLVTNAHATVGTKVTIRDATTTKIVGYAAAAGGGFVLQNQSGLFVAAANAAVTAICATTGADVDVTVFGYLIPA